MDVIDAYMAELDGALRGPKRARTDLLTEARDSLVDATETYERRGLQQGAAELRAVQEFGEVSQIAHGYQAELGLAQSRRTALLCLCSLVLQPVAWNNAWRAAIAPGADDPASLYAVLSELVEWLGAGAMVGSLGAALACGIGVRYLRTWHRPARVTGIFTLTVASLLVVLGLLLTLVNPQPVPLLHAGGLAWVVVFLLIPMMGVALSARRCLRTANEQARA